MRIQVRWIKEGSSDASSSGSAYLSEGESLTVGRETGVAIKLTDGKVSRLHAEIYMKDGGVVIKDAGSTNGTTLDGEQVVQSRWGPGQFVGIGPYRFSLAAASGNLVPVQRGVNTADHDANPGARRRLTRGNPQKVIAGVCAGISDYFGVSLVFTRLVFVVLAFADGLGIVIYLILILVIPAGSKERQPSDVLFYPPPKRRKTFFAYASGVIGIGAGFVTVLDNVSTIFNFFNTYFAHKPPIIESSSDANWISSDGRVSDIERATPSHLPSLFGTALVRWTVDGILYTAQLDMYGSSGTITVAFIDGSSFRDRIVRQNAQVQWKYGGMALVGSHPSETPYAPDSFKMSATSDGVWNFSEACDDTGCHLLTYSDARSMRVSF